MTAKKKLDHGQGVYMLPDALRDALIAARESTHDETLTASIEAGLVIISSNGNTLPPMSEEDAITHLASA